VRGAEMGVLGDDGGGVGWDGCLGERRGRGGLGRLGGGAGGRPALPRRKTTRRGDLTETEGCTRGVR